ncbi:glycosyltransferase family 2 protein [Chryseobacterium wangxinyae]|uniref:glycosyltransferase family 2 protein n=1 Tax=Chryseobacterium sp. CY350 TaxID=2997336 RepID=UPI0022719069|nr:glycosyltransferase family 2 protein [Chryseobacterium sp. CY350]MCY0975825.1 glycosyltransferase family 2 protein [Chryseobacterium sp. CY350]WBZ94566.1 glycosyltransferase family 2 protein [Chryseobacterium sp. CY350]
MNQLAIVIPYYKIDFFEETLQSIAAQSNSNFVLYIGNDASPNSPLPIIQKHFKDNDYRYFDYNENLGGKNLTMQWERILENVSEDWFLILGDDDMIAENFVEEFYKSLQKVNSLDISVIRYSQFWVDEFNKPISTSTNFPPINSTKDIWRSKYFDYIPSSLSEHIFRKDSYNIYGFYKLPLAWYSDDVAILQFSRDKGIFFISKSFARIRISNSNISGKKDNEAQKKEAKYLYEEFILNHYYHYFSNKELLKAIDLHIYETWKTKNKLKINLFKIYFKSRNWFRLLKAPKTYFNLNIKR